MRAPKKKKKKPKRKKSNNKKNSGDERKEKPKKSKTGCCNNHQTHQTEIRLTHKIPVIYTVQQIKNKQDIRVLVAKQQLEARSLDAAKMRK